MVKYPGCSPTSKNGQTKYRKLSPYKSSSTPTEITKQDNNKYTY